MEGTSWTRRQGEVFIRTKFREQHESEYTLSRAQMILDEDWRAAVGANIRVGPRTWYSGPFCYVPAELDMPF